MKQVWLKVPTSKQNLWQQYTIDFGLDENIANVLELGQDCDQVFQLMWPLLSPKCRLNHPRNLPRLDDLCGQGRTQSGILTHSCFQGTLEAFHRLICRKALLAHQMLSQPKYKVF